ncbi:hypothetical protein ACH5RR_023898 [Cinchona calisaya]|uniref:Uncharacterized protein n=1 Tax=Cinchona calisaya TaxID=153742 RepID=A0ABD2ZBZ5_9GENT
MASWSAEHATIAYLQTLNMGKRGKEPNVAEFIAALAAGNNAKLIVMICAGNAGSRALALGAAAQETGGRTVCILAGLEELHASRKALGCHADFIELVVRNAQSLDEYHGADFVLVDSKLEEYKAVLLTAQTCLKKAFLVGYNAIHGEPWNIDSLKAHFLPKDDKLCGFEKKERWVVKFDKITGEEHVYRTT